MTSNGTPPRKRTCHVGLLAAFLFAAGFALANVPGHPVVGPNVLAEGKYGPHFECGYEEMVHGWPLVFLKQDGLYSRADGAPLAWGVGRVSQFRLGSLAVNLALLLLGALVIGWLVDRHIRENGWRFTMIHLLSAVLCVAAVCAFASRRMKTHDGQVAELLRAGFKNIGVAEWQPFGVYWLRRLTGPRYWEWGDTLVGADLEHSDQIATLPGKATIKVLRIRTVKCDAMPSLETYAGLVAIDLMMVNYDYSDVQGDGDPELWPCLQVIAQCDTLQGLNLYETGVTDRGLKELARLPKIRYIDLSGNPGITDDGLVYLASTKSLEKLGLGGTDVTTKGVERLRAALPQCEIARDGKPK